MSPVDLSILGWIVTFLGLFVSLGGVWMLCFGIGMLLK